MALATGLNTALTDWLAALASGRRATLESCARRFASLLSSASELESAPVDEQAIDWPGAILSITSGLHRGATLELTAREYLVGSGDDCDVVLRDRHVAAHHCRLARKWSGFEVRDLRTDEPQVIAPKLVAYGGGAIEAQYEVGGVVFTLRQPPAAHMAGQSEKAPAYFAPGVLLAALAVGIVLIIWAVGAAGRQDERGASRSVTERTATGSSQSLSGLLEQARHALADDSLHVDARNGRLRVEGVTANAAVKTRIRALSDDLRGTIVVEDHVEYVERRAASPGPFPLRLRGVMIGNPSYFLTDTGARYFVGGVLPDGAEVLAIDAAQIRFRFDGRVVTYKLE
jgi:hypothetical protein